MKTVIILMLCFMLVGCVQSHVDYVRIEGDFDSCYWGLYNDKYYCVRGVEECSVSLLEKDGDRVVVVEECHDENEFRKIEESSGFDWCAWAYENAYCVNSTKVCRVYRHYFGIGMGYEYEVIGCSNRSGVANL